MLTVALRLTFAQLQKVLAEEFRTLGDFQRRRAEHPAASDTATSKKSAAHGGIPHSGSYGSYGSPRHGTPTRDSFM